MLQNLVLVVLLGAKPLSIVAETACDDAYQCINSDLTDLTSDLTCSGYSSCRGVNEISTTVDGKIYCQGGYSCYQVSNIQSNSTLTCDGLYSCSDIDLIESHSNIFCYGDKSCYGSTMTFYENSEESDNNIYCYGDESCANANIKTTTLIGNGVGALAYSTIENVGDSLIVYFNSYYSGYQATVNCNGNGDTTCEIICHSNGCNELTFNCDDSDGKTCDVICDDSEKNDLCPNGYEPVISVSFNNSYVLNTQDLLLSAASGKYDVCNDTSAMADSDCIDYQGCESISALIATNDNEPICCSANEACQNGVRIESESSKSNIQCDGKNACKNVYNVRFAAKGNVYCTGDASCDSSDIATNDEDSRVDSRLVCSGYKSCSDAAISDIETVHCGSRESCAVASVSNVEIVYGLSQQSLRLADISNISEAVYCLGSQSCSSAMITNTPYIYSSGYRGLYGSVIKDVENSIYAYGYEALSYSNVTNIGDSIYCVGDLACAQSTLTNMKSVVTSGVNALQGATIVGTSETYWDASQDISSLIVSIGDDHNGDSTYIHCNNTDLCVIYCETYNACNKVVIYCELDGCITSCDESSGVKCPQIYYVSGTVTPAPTPCQEVLVNKDVQTGVSVTVVVLLVIGNAIIGLIWMGDRRKHKAAIDKWSKKSALQSLDSQDQMITR